MKKSGVKVLEIVIVIVLLAIILFVGRNMFIVSKLANIAEEKIQVNNYHQIVYSYHLGDYQKEETFKLGDKKKVILTQINEDSISTTTMYGKKISNDKDIYSVNIYGESKEGKKAKIAEKMKLVENLKNEFYTENWWDLLTSSAFTSITTTTFNGNQCYYITNFKGKNTDTKEGMYINKDTGLPISIMGYEYESSSKGEDKIRSSILEYVYEFNTVTEEDFVEPNLNEYQR